MTPLACITIILNGAIVDCTPHKAYYHGGKECAPYHICWGSIVIGPKDGLAPRATYDPFLKELRIVGVERPVFKDGFE